MTHHKREDFGLSLSVGERWRFASGELGVVARIRPWIEVLIYCGPARHCVPWDEAWAAFEGALPEQADELRRASVEVEAKALDLPPALPEEPPPAPEPPAEAAAPTATARSEAPTARRRRR